MSGLAFLVLLGMAGLLTLAGDGLLRRFEIGSWGRLNPRTVDWLREAPKGDRPQVQTAPGPDLPHRGSDHRLVFSFLAGLLAWHLLLQIWTLTGIPWKRSLLAVGLVGLTWLCRRAARGRPAARSPISAATPAGWGDAAAAFAVLAFALLAPTLWITTPDFIFHWGVKGEHAFLARGIDYAWLAEPWNWSLHPDYPHLLPLLYGSTARLTGHFDAPALQLWSVLFLGGIVLAARAALREAGIGRGAVQGGVALVGLAAGAYSVGYLLAGGADGMIALAVVAALPALLRPLDSLAPDADLEIGIAAGFAVASKIEGLPLAAFLIGIHLLRRVRGGLFADRGGFLRAWRRAGLATCGPASAVALPWLLQVYRHHLFQAGNSGPFDWRRGRIILEAMLDALGAPELHALPWAVGLLPLLWLARRTRPAAAVLSAQLGFYVWAYFASVLEPRFYVLSNFARLLFQLLPAVLVGVVIVLSPRSPGREPEP